MSPSGIQLVVMSGPAGTGEAIPGAGPPLSATTAGSAGSVGLKTAAESAPPLNVSLAEPVAVLGATDVSALASTISILTSVVMVIPTAQSCELRRQATVRGTRRTSRVGRRGPERSRGSTRAHSAATSFRSAKFTRLSAILTSDSQTEFLQQMSAIDVLATDNTRSLAQLRGAVSKASAAFLTAAEAQKRGRAAERAVASVGDGKIVDAPTEGQVVDVRSIEDDGHYIGRGASSDELTRLSCTGIIEETDSPTPQVR